MGNFTKVTPWLFALSLTPGCGSSDPVLTEKHDDESASEKIDTAAPPTLTRLQPDGDGHKQVLERIRTGEYAVRQRTSELRAFNRAQRIDAIWTGGGIRVALAPQDSPGPLSRTKLDAKIKAEPAKRADPVSFELRTVAAARGSARVAIPAEKFSLGGCRKDGAVDEMGACLRRAESRQSAWVEWWENREDGLEQGFDLEKAPIASDGQAPLRLELSVQGATVRIDENGQGATLTLPEGTEVRYTKLLATDANQSSLPIRVVASTGGLSIEVDDRGATYPLHVDPLVGVQTTPFFQTNVQDAGLLTIAGAGDVNGDGFGDVVAASPFYRSSFSNEGRVWVFHGTANGISSTPSRILNGGFENAWMGEAVAGLGDVTGDGLSDIAVSVLGYDNGQNDEGAVYVYYGSGSGIGATPDRILESNEPNQPFGRPAAAGDVNGDGVADLLVGCGGCRNVAANAPNAGRFHVYHGGSGGLQSTPARTIAMVLPDMYFGYALSGAGDVNGDGVSDIVVGADGMSSGETEEGIVFIYHGVQGQGIPATAATALQQNKERANFGRVVAGVGDTNGDGYSDIVIGAGPNAMDDEQVSLYRGGGGGVLPTPFRYYRPSVAPPAGIGTSFGESISGAGDIDGDGLADFVVGEPWYSNGQDGEGAIHVFYGIASNSPSLEIREVRESNRVRAHYGFQVSGAGDVNGDGYSDVAVSAWGWSSPELNEGALFVHRGSPSTAIAGGGITAGDTQDLFGSSLDVGDVTGDGLDDLIVGGPGADRAYVAAGPLWATPVWNKQGQAGSGFGSSVAIVGDVNGDGNEDVLVGAPLYTNGQAQEGRVELYLGGPGGPGSSPVWSYEPNLASIQLGKSVATGDVNGDGYPDVVIGAPGYDNGSSTDVGAAFVFFGNGSSLATSPSVTLLGEQSFAGFGNAVATANVNGDAYSDIAVSAPFFTADQTREGVVFIYHGTATGPSTAFTKRLEGTTADAEFGSAIASAGDINRDGRGDFIVGSPRYSNGQPNEGRISFYLGSATGLNSAVQHLESDLAGALYGASLAGVGDIDGDYRSDVSIGAPGHSSGAGAVYRYKGSSLGDLAPLSTEVSNTSIKGFGSAISRGGDANGDGFPDYSIGAPLATFNGQINQGVVAHRGGNGTFFDGTGAVSLRVKQRRLSTTSLLPPRSRSDSATAFEVAVLSARTPVGRTRVKLEVEAKSLGTVFNGSGLVSSSWFDTGVSGPALPLQVTRPAGDSTHWRARLVYDTARIGPWHQPRSRWYHGGDPREPQGVHVRIP